MSFAVFNVSLTFCLTSALSFLFACAFGRHHFEIVSEQTGQCTRLHDIDYSKRAQSQLVAAVDLCDGHETELLLCYNRKCMNSIFLFFVSFRMLE